MTQRSDAGEPRTRNCLISIQALYHWAPINKIVIAHLTNGSKDAMDIWASTRENLSAAKAQTSLRIRAV